MVFELNLYIRIDVRQMAQGVGSVQGKGSIIDKGMEIREAWLVPEASSLFQEASSTGQGEALAKTRSSGSQQDQSGWSGGVLGWELRTLNLTL